MAWLLVCPACGHFGSVRIAYAGGHRGKVFKCSCGLTLSADCSCDLVDKLNRLAQTAHTARVLEKKKK